MLMSNRFCGAYRKAARLLSGLLVLNLVLVFTHLGEFWPFSIFPMFSQGGREWVRSVVREVEDPGEGPELWQSVSRIEDLPGEPFPLDSRGINQNDISNFISKTRVWNVQRVAGIRSVFEADLEHQMLLVLRTEGSLDGERVAVRFTPFILMKSDSTVFNPHLDIARE